MLWFSLGQPPGQYQQPTRPRTFEEELDNRLHSNLIIRPRPRRSQPSSHHSQNTPAVTTPAASTKGARPIDSNTAPIVTTAIASTVDEPHIQANATARSKQQEKKRILDDYQAKYGEPFNDAPPIVSRKKGKQKTNPSSERPWPRMRPELDKGYRVKDLNLYHVIAILLRESMASFLPFDFTNLRAVNKTFAEIIPKLIRWHSVDFSSLRQPRLNYEAQEVIDPH